MVQDTSGSNFYTRAGNFTFDKEGYLVNPDGHQLQGYQIDTDGNIGSISDIYIPGERVSAPAATTEFNFDINLNAGAQTGDTYTTAQTVYDSLGNAVPVTFTFTRQAAAQTWTVTGAIPTSAGSGVTFGGNASMNIVFDDTGAMTSPAANVTTALTLTNGADTPLSMNWASEDANGNSYGDVTGYASASGTTFQYQDGYPAGMLRGISVDETGVVTASYSNGEMTPLYQIALVDFPSYDGLTKMGKNLYVHGSVLLVGRVGSLRWGAHRADAVVVVGFDQGQRIEAGRLAVGRGLAGEAVVAAASGIANAVERHGVAERRRPRRKTRGCPTAFAGDRKRSSTPHGRRVRPGLPGSPRPRKRTVPSLRTTRRFRDGGRRPRSVLLGWRHRDAGAASSASQCSRGTRPVVVCGRAWYSAASQAQWGRVQIGERERAGG